MVKRFLDLVELGGERLIPPETLLGVCRATFAARDPIVYGEDVAVTVS